MSTYHRVFITTSTGVRRIREAEGASYVQDSVVKALRLARPNDSFTEIESPEPGYSTLKRKILIIHTGLTRDRDTVIRYVKALKGRVVGSEWVGRLYDDDDDFYGLACVSRNYEAIEAECKRQQNANETIDYFIIDLVKRV